MRDRDKWSKAYCARFASHPHLLKKHTTQWTGSAMDSDPERERELQTYLNCKLGVPKDQGAALWPLKAQGSRQKWDLLMHAGKKVEHRGIILVEAKAHHGELEWAGKRVTGTSKGSRNNHAAIVATLLGVQHGLRKAMRLRGRTELAIGADARYQLVNRIAAGWLAASELRIDATVVYLGFVSCEPSPPKKPPKGAFRDAADWQRAMGAYLHGVFPVEWVGRQVPAGNGAAFRFLIEAVELAELARGGS